MKDVVRFAELGVETRKGPRRACVVTPLRDILLSRERLTRLDGALNSELDRAIYAHLEADGGYHGLIFRGSNDDGTARYGLADDLGDDETELVADLLEAHMRFFRAIEAIGVYSMVGVGFSDRDRIAYENAAELLADRLTKQLADAEASQAEELRLTQWLVERQATWTSMTFKAYVDKKLAAALVAAERQRSHLHAQQ